MKLILVTLPNYDDSTQWLVKADSVKDALYIVENLPWFNQLVTRLGFEAKALEGHEVGLLDVEEL